MLDYGLDTSGLERDLALPDLVAEGDALRHIAALGVIGRELSFYAAQLPFPAEPFRVELTGPDGQVWAWGPEDAAQRVQGSALDFCLRVTHRRSLAETGLTAVGEDARKWLEIARVFL